MNKIILRIKSNELLSHTLDEIEGQVDEYIGLNCLPDYAVKLQTLAEKIANTIYRAAKVCSFTARYLANNLVRYIHPPTLLFI